MSRQLSGRSRRLEFFGVLLAFVLSAAMGVAFVALVDKTHDLFSGAAGTVPAVAGIWQGKWHALRSMTEISDFR